MPHEISPTEIRAAQQVSEVLIASATNGLQSKRLVWYAGTGLFAIVTGAGFREAETTSIVAAAVAYNKIDV